MSSTSEKRRFPRLNRRQGIALTATLVLLFLPLLLVTLDGQTCYSGRRTIRTLNQAVALTTVKGQRYFQQEAANVVDLNALQATSHGKSRQERVLILTPLKNAQQYLPRYFELLDRMTYPKHLISLAFLVSDTTDDTVQILQEQASVLLNRWGHDHRYHDISIYKKDFAFDLPEDKRHTFELQPLRRSFMARSRNYLLSAALKDDHAWVLWLDADLVEYPPTILEDLMSVDVDVVVPNCLRETEDRSFWGYDKNNWQETERSLELQKDLDPDYVLLEGYYEFLTHRYLMVDMPTHHDRLEKVPLDGVGATFTLVKAHVHREGANFPAFVYKHQVETEGFAKMAKSMGFGVYGLPSYLIYHIMNS
ncbi:Anp1-domain-containing protein [Dichotomocladium elegans]|nr:Anp1-domain-containing protein [Dichotomocladium elegans]